MMYAFKLGIKSLFFRRRQYTSLLIVCVLGVAISLFCIFLVKGMLSSLTMKAKIYYGGDYQFIGGKNSLSFDETDTFIEKLKNIFPKDAIISKRFDFDAANSGLYFEGTGVRQRVIKGVDFQKEQELFSRFNYVDGSPKEMAGTNGILLSEPIAKILGVRVGDSITLMLKTNQGYNNTVQLLVNGIFRDSSLFGMYTSYMDIDCLRQTYGCADSWANRIGVFFPSESPTEKETQYYQAELESIFTMFPLVSDKNIFYDKLLSGSFLDSTYALIRLSANLQDVQILKSAMYGICAFVICMLVLIIIAGIGSTYRVLVMKRINEIGIYMAIGMKRSGIILSLISEAILLLISGCFLGLIVSFVFCRIAMLFNLSFIPAFDIFLTNGNLHPLFDLGYTIIISVIVIVTTLLAVLFSIMKSVRITPVKALAITE